MNRDNAYRANNFSYIPQKAERFDIISGRKLTYKWFLFWFYNDGLSLVWYLDGWSLQNIFLQLVGYF